MKSIVLTLFFSLLISPAFADCDSAYSAATYALSHTKKALKADNFDHQMYYAERALEAFDKTKGLIQNCGCNESMDSVLDGLESLKEAIDPIDWEMGRHYSKRAYENAQEILSTLDVCSGDTPATIDYNIKETTSFSNEQVNLSSEAASIQEQQRKLEEEKEKLAEQQRQLEEKLENQRQLAEKMRVNRQLELDEQLMLKGIAEQSLYEIEASLKKLASSLGCNNALKTLTGNYSRSDKTLETESLEKTRDYYLQQTISMQQKFSEALNKCSPK